MTVARWCIVMGVVLASTAAFADDDSDVTRARVERARADQASEIQLRAYELLDELVYEWTQKPPFASETPVILADVTAPVGFNSGLEALIENHFQDLVISNANTHVRLVHCAACSAMTTHSTQEGTVISRGIDQPDVLKQLGVITASTHAIFLDVEAEGSTLVLRARICGISSTLPIVYAKTLSSATSHAPLLREASRLVSAEDARREYVDTLERNSGILIPIRLSISQFGAPADTGTISTVPMIFLSSGVELSINHARAWVGSLTAGAMYLPTIYSAAIAQARVGRLLTGSAVSLTHPDLYLYAGASLVGVYGPTAFLLSNDTTNIAELIAATTQALSAFAFYPSFQLGFDVRVNNRVGAGVFLETTPTLQGAQAIGPWLDFAFVQVHALGGEVTFWF
jgi:hypothetical protein